MSTERQNYLLRRWRALIRNFATTRGLNIMQIYVDRRKSGLNVEGRAGLRAMLNDVTSASPGLYTSLVHDVSRRARFKDANESRQDEFVCRRAGLDVVYGVDPLADAGAPARASRVNPSLRRPRATSKSAL